MHYARKGKLPYEHVNRAGEIRKLALCGEVLSNKDRVRQNCCMWGNLNRRAKNNNISNSKVIILSGSRWCGESCPLLSALDQTAQEKEDPPGNN